MTKYKERTVIDDYKKDTYISHYSETHSGAVGWDAGARPNRPVETPGFNGVTGYIPQLARLVIRLSPSDSKSADLRRYIDFILPDFAAKNTSTVLYIRPEESTSPSVAAEWLDGTRQVVELKNTNAEDISKTFDLLSHQSTADENIFRAKSTSTQLPSIQGFNYHCMMDPKPLNLTELPKTKLSDAWDVDLDETYYREEEKLKLLHRPLPTGSDRKDDPLGPFGPDDGSNFHY